MAWSVAGAVEASGWKLVTAKAKPPGSRQVLRESRRLWLVL